jgi:hypothetical protein
MVTGKKMWVAGIALSMFAAMPAVAQMTVPTVPDKPMAKPDSSIPLPSERGMKSRPGDSAIKTPDDPKSKTPSDSGAVVTPPTTDSKSIVTPPKNVDPKIDSANSGVDRRNKKKSDSKTKGGDGTVIAR